MVKKAKATINGKKQLIARISHNFNKKKTKLTKLDIKQ